MTSEQIKVSLRAANGTGKAKAFADVEYLHGESGKTVMRGFIVYDDPGKGPRVAPPARKGESLWFDVVSLIGPIRKLVDEAVIREYRKGESQTPAKGSQAVK